MAVSQEQGRPKRIHLQTEKPVTGSRLDVANMVTGLQLNTILRP